MNAAEVNKDSKLNKLFRTLTKKLRRIGYMGKGALASYKNRHRSEQQVLWLSLGENCLPDDILQRHHRKSYSSPYSSGRVNIDYATELEKDGYKHLLEKESLVYGETWGKKVVRSTYYAKCDDIFEAAHMQGFEFTHHNPLALSADKNSFERRIGRLNEARYVKDFVFFYHHRRTEKSNFDLLRKKLNDFRSFYSNGKARCAIVLFYQSIVHTDDQRRLEVNPINPDLIEFVFHTKAVWAGDDDRIFWAHVDDDLITKMFEEVDKHLKFEVRLP
jgi:hypothetical protein